MKRIMAVVVVFAMFFALSGLVCAAEKAKKEEKKPDATLTLKEGQVAVGIGWSWGGGELSYKGQKYKFKVKGLSIGDIGITKAEATGKVYDLKNIEDFNGTYIAATAAGTLGVGAGATALKNDKDVVIHLFPKTKGISLKLAGEGVTFTLEKK